MMMRLGVAAVALFVGTGAASAASFDCAKARTPLEKLICASPELSRNDEVLAKAYATALGGLSEAAKQVVQQSQREWHDQVVPGCTNTKPVESFSEEQRACVTSEFYNRARALEESRMQNGWRFYMSEHFAVLEDPATDYSHGAATKAFSSPRIDDGTDVARAFNALMEEKAAAFGDILAKDGTLADSDETSDTDNRVKVEAVTAQRISLSINGYWFGHGAAHGNYSINYLHFLIEEKRPLVASDVFKGSGWEDKLGELVLAELERTIEGGIWDEARGGVPKTAADPANWNFSGEGLIVQFQPYEVTAYAYGAPTVTIGWDALGPLLADGAVDRLSY